MTTITLYGISNCDTVKKARSWLDRRGIDYRFHDFRQDGLDASAVSRWLEALPLDQLVNKRSTSWRGLDKATQNNLSKDNAIPLLLAQPTLIKRPLVEVGDTIFCGFSADHFATQFSD